MLSHCMVCGTPTDLALIDVLTPEQIKQIRSVPLVGVCGETECIESILTLIKERRK